MPHVIIKHSLWLVALLAVAVWGVVSDVYPPTKMVLIAVCVFLIVKWQALRNRPSSELSLSARSVVAWYILVPTLDASRFLNAKLPADQRPSLKQWRFAVTKTLAGGLLFSVAAPAFLGKSIWLAGWLGMIGIVLMLHFGMLELIVLFWRSSGRDIRPLMMNPLAAQSRQMAIHSQLPLELKSQAHE